MSKKLTHIDSTGRPRMVDVSAKPMTHRVARAEGWVRMSPEALEAITEGRVHKGDVTRIAELAGIQGCKRTSDLIPLCHPLPIDAVDVAVWAGLATPPHSGPPGQCLCACGVGGVPLAVEGVAPLSAGKDHVRDKC